MGTIRTNSIGVVELAQVVEIKVLDHFVSMPVMGSANAAGFDLHAAVTDQLPIAGGQWANIPIGLCIALPRDMEAQIRPRSGMALEHGVTVLNAPGTIDADYRGEIHVMLINHGTGNFTVKRGMRIAQLVIKRTELVAFKPVLELSSTERGEQGYGSTGE